MSKSPDPDAVKKLKLRPGGFAPLSGQYTMRVPGGKRRQVTAVRGRRLPPAPRGVHGLYWRLTDATR